MTFREYQIKARSTTIYPNKGKNITYPSLGLAGEAGEICNNVKKIFRDNDGKLTKEMREKISQEIGDCLWYIAALSSELKINLDDISAYNIEKLMSRKLRGKLHGSGDLR